MADTTRELLETYYGVLTRGAAAYDDGRGLRPILDPELVFEGPIAGHVTGAERFIRGVRGFVETVLEIQMLQRLEIRSEAAVLYDAVMPGGTVRFAEFFGIAGGQIQTLRLLYDASEYRARGGR